MSYVFISYSHASADSAFAARLADSLIAAGVPVWYDRHLVSGDRWERELRARIDEAAAVVVLMSECAAESSWVRLEVGRARYRGRPVRPLLISGEVFPGLAGLQYEIVPVGSSLPSTEFADRLLRDLAEATEQRSGPSVVYGPGAPAPNPHFVGRGQLLLDLEANPYWGQSVAVGALRGTGGVGKTQLAAEYARRRAQDYDVIAWVDSERPELLAAQLAGLAPLVGVAAIADVDTTARMVVAALERTTLCWLVVFDNAERSEDLVGWLPRTGHGHVLVTSRSRGWHQLVSTVDVDVMSRVEAVTLLRLSIPTIDDDVANDIAELLGDLPLAVEQAAGYLAATDLPSVDFVRLLRTRADELLDKGAVLAYDNTVATVWDVSRASLQAASPAAAQLLALCAFVGPEPIPLDLFTTQTELLPPPLRQSATDAINFADTIGALIVRSLARRNGDGCTLSVHRLLAAAIRRQLTEAERRDLTGTVRALLFQYLPEEIIASPEGWPRWQALLPHVLANAGQPWAPSGEPDRLVALLNGAGTYLVAHGLLPASVTQFDQALRIAEANLGADNVDTLTSRNNLGFAYEEGGQARRAIPLYEATLADRIRVLGPDHTDTLECPRSIRLARMSVMIQDPSGEIRISCLRPAMPPLRRTLTLGKAPAAAGAFVADPEVLLEVVVVGGAAADADGVPEDVTVGSAPGSCAHPARAKVSSATASVAEPVSRIGIFSSAWRRAATASRVWRLTEVASR